MSRFINGLALATVVFFMNAGDVTPLVWLGMMFGFVMGARYPVL